MPGFVLFDLRFVLESQPDIIQTVQQAMARESVYHESHRESSSVLHLQRFQVDRELVVFDLFRTAHDLRHLLFVELHRQQAVFQAVVGKNVGKRRCDPQPEAKIRQRPDGMFARRPAAEVLPRNQDRGLRIARLVECKTASLLPALSIPRKPPIVEQEFPKSRALDTLQELLRDDLIGIHVYLIERDNNAGVFAKRLHRVWLTLCGSGASPAWTG